MTKQLDVYRDWLGIADAARPLNYYQLMRLNQFEDDPAKVRAHYRKMNAHVRKFATGEFATQSQELLNELAKAMLCLTDARRKGEYDATLGRKEPGGGRRYTFEQILLGRKILEQAQLEKARTLASTIGIEIRDAVMQQKLAPPEAVMQAYAESQGLPYVDLADVGVDEAIVPQVPAVMARQHSCAPVMVDDGQLLMASPNPIAPEIEDQLRLRTGMPVRSVLCTPAGINQVIAKYYPKEAAAAEMAAGGAGGKPAKPAAGADKAEKQAAKAAAPSDPARRKQLTIVAGNFGFMGTMLALFFIGQKIGVEGIAMQLGAAAVVAAVAAGATWTLAK